MATSSPSCRKGGKKLFYNGWKNLGRKQDHITMSGKRKASSDKSVGPSKSLKPEVVIPDIEEDFQDPIAALADFGDDLGELIS